MKNEAKKICRAIKEAGGEAWYVGGYVRDRLLQTDEYLTINRPEVYPGDIDLEVYGMDEDKLEDILSSAGVYVKKVGRSFPVWKSEHGVDIAFPRKEKGDGVHHNTNVELMFDKDMDKKEAMSRRDLTINTFMHCGGGDGRLLYCKGALDDLRNGVIRHQNKKFVEDPLRVFRVARFAAQLNFTVARETVELCQRMDTASLSHERIAEETKKALMSDHPSKYFEVLRDMHQLAFWFTGLYRCIGVEQPEKYHPEGDVFNHTMLALDYAAEYKMPYLCRLAVLCHDLGKATTREIVDGEIKFKGHAEASAILAGPLLKTLCVSKRSIDLVVGVVRNHMKIYDLEKTKASQKSYNKLYDSCLAELLIELTECDRNGKGRGLTDDESLDFERSRKALTVYNHKICFRTMDKVTANDLILAGHKPSSAFKPALELAHKMWLADVPHEIALPQVLAKLRKEEKILT